MATEDWIQESLARLESLEDERNKHEAALETADDSATLRMHTQAIERLEAKIRSLYAELEAAAEQGDGGDASDDDSDDDADSDDGDHDQARAARSDVETRLFRRDDVAAEAAAVSTNKAAPAQSTASLFNSGPVPQAAPFGSVSSASQVSAAQVSPFGGGGSTPQASPFGGGGSTPQASPFGGGAAQVSAAPSASPFGGGSAPQASPFGGSAPETSPFGGAVPSSMGASSGTGFTAPSSSFSGSGASMDDDEGRRSGGAPWGLVIGLVVLLGGVGGYFALRTKDEPPPVVPLGPPPVIKRIELPPDTQGPKVVKGSDVDSISGTQYKEGRSHPSGGGGGGSSSAAAGDKPKKKDPRTKIESTDDPLAGIDK